MSLFPKGIVICLVFVLFSGLYRVHAMRLGKSMLGKSELGMRADGLGPTQLSLDLDNLVKNSRYRSRFFSNLDLNEHGEDLFTNLFFRREGEGLKEIPLETAEKNWRTFMDLFEKAFAKGKTRIKKQDLEAAAVSFIHRNSDYNYNNEMLTSANWAPSDEFLRENLSPIGRFFHKNLNPVDYYISPYFRLTPEDPYLRFVIRRILSDRSNMDTPEIILKVWQDIKAYEVFYNFYTIENGVHYEAMFFQMYKSFYDSAVADLSEHISDSIRELRAKNALTDLFMRAMLDAMAEDQELYSLNLTIADGL